MNVSAKSAPLIDLHVHSTASDGLLSPSEVVDLAATTGITILGLTDHDTTRGVDEAIASGHTVGVEVVPGVELSTSVDTGELHVLGYLIDHHNPELESRLSEFRDARRSRAVRIVERLNEIGVIVDLARVREMAGAGSIGRAHVARALIEAGHVTSIDEAFDRFLGRGKPAYVPRLRLTPVDAVHLVHASGGVAVLAHPFTVDDLDTTLPQLVSAGLGGLEVYYSLYNNEQQVQLAEIARRFELVPTGGSDFHGSGEREGREIGTAEVPMDTLDRLRDARDRLH